LSEALDGPLFVDANVPIYAAGRPHPLKQPCVELLTAVASRPDRFVTDAEVLQELLHRYRALGLWEQGGRVLSNFALLFRGHVEPVFGSDIERAASFADRYVALSARDLLHLAVMQRLGIRLIVSADKDFDKAVEIGRLDPGDFSKWRTQLA